MDLEKIKEANRERNAAIIDAASMEIPPEVDGRAARISAALFVVAEQFRARGEELKRLKRKGHVSTKAALDFAAEQVEDVAGSLAHEGVAWNRAASEVAGVAVSLAKDGVTPNEPGESSHDDSGRTFERDYSKRCPSAYAFDNDTAAPCYFRAGHKGMHSDGHAQWLDESSLYTVDEQPGDSADPAQRCAGLYRLPSGDLLPCRLQAEHDGVHRHGEGFSEYSWPLDGDPERWPGADVVEANAYASSQADNPDAAEGDIFPGQCADESAGERCMLPDTHTGVHIGRKGGRWPRKNPMELAKFEGQSLADGTELAVIAVPAAAFVDQVRAAVAASASAIVGITAGLSVNFKADTMDAVGSPPFPGEPGYCHRCDTDTHACGGCGDSVTHEQGNNCGKHDAAPRCPAVLENIPCALDAGHDGDHVMHPAETVTPPEEYVQQFTGNEPIGTTVNVGGIEFVKHSENPFGNITGVYVMTDLPEALPAQPDFIAVEPGGRFTAPVSGTYLVAAGSGLQVSLMTPREAATVDLASLHGVPGAPKPYQSVSSIETMADCGMKYRLQYRDRVPQAPAWWNVGGRVFHGYVENVERRLAGQSPSGIPTVLDILATSMTREVGMLFNDEVEKARAESGMAPERWTAAKRGEEGEEFWRGLAPDMAARYLVGRMRWAAEYDIATTPAGWPAVELEFMADFGGVPLKGFIDQVWRERATGDLIVRDLKAGARKPSSSFQLGPYAHALALLGIFPREDVRERSSAIRGGYYMARKAENTAEVSPLEEWPAEVIAYRARTTAAADAAGNFVARPSEFCGSCGVRAACPIMGMKGA